MRATAAALGRCCGGRRRLLLLGAGLAGLGLAQAFVVPSSAPLLRTPAGSSVLAAPRRMLSPMDSTSLPVLARRGPAPLWIKGQPSIEEETPAEMVRSFAAERGVDSRQLNFLLNLAFITLVAATVLAKVLTVDLEFWRGWTPLEIFFRIPLDNWDGYMSALTDHPVIVKAITSCSVYTLGDGVAQMYEGKTLGEIDRARVARSAAAGLIGHGPLSHLWYGVSEGFFDLLGWEGWWTTFPKIGVDQLVWSPIWNGCYIALLGLMKRESLGEIWETVRSTSFSLITSGLKLWPLAHVITYGVIPVENRLLWVDLVEILWVTILSREAAGADAAKEEAAASASASAASAGAEQPGAMLAMAASEDAAAAAAAATGAGVSGEGSGAEAVPIATSLTATELMKEPSAAVPVPVAAEPPQDGPLLP